MARPHELHEALIRTTYHELDRGVDPVVAADLGYDVPARYLPERPIEDEIDDETPANGVYPEYHRPYKENLTTDTEKSVGKAAIASLRDARPNN